MRGDHAKRVRGSGVVLRRRAQSQISHQQFHVHEASQSPVMNVIPVWFMRRDLILTYAEGMCGTGYIDKMENSESNQVDLHLRKETRNSGY